MIEPSHPYQSPWLDQWNMRLPAITASGPLFQKTHLALSTLFIDFMRRLSFVFPGPGSFKGARLGIILLFWVWSPQGD